MNKANVFIISLILGALAFCANPNIRANVSGNVVYYSDTQMQFEMKGSTVTTTNGIVLYLDNIAGFNQLNFYIGAASAGTITTANVRPVLS